jgi:hypothetical protein
MMRLKLYVGQYKLRRSNQMRHTASEGNNHMSAMVTVKRKSRKAAAKLRSSILVNNLQQVEGGRSSHEGVCWKSVHHGFQWRLGA